MGVGFCGAGELIAGLDGDADSGGTREGGDAVQLGVAALACDGDAVEAAGSGSNGLFNRVEAVENFHTAKFTGGKLWANGTCSS